MYSDVYLNQIGLTLIVKIGCKSVLLMAICSLWRILHQMEVGLISYLILCHKYLGVASKHVYSMWPAS